MILAAFLMGFILAFSLTIRYFGKLLDLIIEGNSGRGLRIGSFKTHLGVGRRDLPKVEKAAIARVGLGANSSEETIYWNAFQDDAGEDLHSGKNYQILFSGPPDVRYDLKGFWSLTVYGYDKFLVPNEEQKYSLGNEHPFEVNEKGAFIIHLSRNRPLKDADWLPLPQVDEKFSVALRCYIPGEQMKKGTQQINMPIIKQIK
jgi:hypothetical protein